MGDGGEAHFVGDLFAEFDDEFAGERDDAAGVEVEEMVVGGVGVDEVVVGLFAGAEVDLLEEGGVDEVFDGAVDGGFGDAVVGVAEFEEEFFGFEGAAEFLDGVEDGEALGGEFELVLAKKVAKEMFG